MTKLVGTDSNWKETELCLGLPGAETAAAAKVNGIKRVFAETVEYLKLSNIHDESSSTIDLMIKNKDIIPTMVDKNNKHLHLSNDDHAKPPAKAQVVGWPPVRNYRKNVMTTTTKKSNEDEEEMGTMKNIGAAFVKVSIDGAPYLRKMDLKMYKTYRQLSDALAMMFSSFTVGDCGSQQEGMIDFMNERKLMDLLNNSEYVTTYEDKDGDWMLVGDVPWEMFVDSCKRLRIMKGSEAIGLAPRAMEKCKNKNRNN